ncbi:putative leucine-rich repeat-containing, plant-type, leucine-rich repeat domain, L [Rosa chinensis]|uniref:Putative leucine-rich repeat-containing, plant-type, leucine-rich repeat domain, L n=1 Tax=Rosa chinensis TaxID=74649 RepID=A0A2P6Q5V2_ROSCH|nr:receptor-like protein EIX1 [Rosa chinensis]PRQ29561.1 putative leucine-rich repeat-containing, plant-type, leucine-rich repeat domain, L [Rosa chinensis]
MASIKTSFRLLLAVFLLLLTDSVPSRATLANSGAKNLTLACFEEDRKALLEFKRSLDDPLHLLSSWIGEDCCKWTRVRCSNQTGHVVELDLSNVCGATGASREERSCLGGELSPSLVNLTHLNYLNLSGNTFHGIPIPSFIGSLEKLRYLDLSLSGFVGMVPPHLGNLSKLLHLDLHLDLSTYSDIWVSDLKWLSGLSSLQYLDLDRLNLSQATDHWVHAINMLPSLFELHFSSCKLHGSLPQSLPHVNLTSLLVIDLSSNNFQSSLPQWLFNISTLVTAEFDFSEFTGSIPEVSLLKDLETLELSRNSLSGPFPISIGNLLHLQALHLSENPISGSVPTSIGNLLQLRTLSLSQNSISGPLPASIGNLFHLETLDLSQNSISGPLPASIGNLFHLETLDLSQNSISGPLPTSVGNLSHLTMLDLSFNMMNGSIPKSIGQLTELAFLNLLSNQWEGVISESHLQNLTRLLDLRLSSKSLVFNISQEWIPFFNLSLITIRDCQFVSPAFPAWLRSQFIVYIVLSNVGISDTIPEWFWRNSPHLSWLDLSNNQLRGKLPYVELDLSGVYVNLENNYLEGSIPLWPNVLYLKLGSNRFSGPIPLNIGQEMSTLGSLDLSRNNLSGSIPHSLTKLKSLSSIDLSRNCLSGSIPKDWEGLLTIDFSNNNLSGQIPPSLCSQQISPSWLRLSNNNLSGELGPSLQNCQNLFTLDLGGNKFSGAIPQWIGEDLRSLQFLLLGENKFTGSIPQQLCALSGLHVLDLSQNNLSGSIPRCLDNLTQLTNLGSMAQPFPSLRDTPDMDPWHMDLDPKGVEYEYTSILPLVNTIDLSSNNLSGEIPEEMRNLSNLGSLNLSRNLLTGKIPEDIGSLQRLQTLDLSCNHLHGPIPLSMTDMTLLSKLNLSYNDLSGPIPSANQFQTFNDPTLFEGNLGLCGIPLPTQCSSSPDGNPEVKEDAGEDEEGSGKIWFYVSTTMGFIMGFWAVFGSLVLKRSWRHAYFKFVDDMKDRLILVITLKCMACLRRMTEQERQT